MKTAVRPGPSAVLLDLARLQTSLPYEAVAHHLRHAVSNAGRKIATTFFDPAITTPYTPNGVDWTKHRDTFATAYMAWHVAHHTAYGFNLLVDHEAAHAVWAGFLATHGETLGKDIFFQGWIDSGHWRPIVEDKDHILADALNIMTTPQFAAAYAAPLARSTHGRGLSLLLHMLHELDSPHFGRPFFCAILSAFRTHLPTNLAPKASDRWRLDFFNNSVASAVNFWMGPCGMGVHHERVEALVNRQTVITADRKDPSNTNSLVAHVTKIFGRDLARWLSSGDASPFATGVAPRNTHIEATTVSLAGGFVPETQVSLLSENCNMVPEVHNIPVEAVHENDIIIGANGAKALVSDESVITTGTDAVRIYGFNDETPFFTGGQMFWTTEGWKAIHPEIAIAENAHISVGKLQPGDVVLKAKEREDYVEDGMVTGVIQYWDYESVPISSITSNISPAGTPLYGIHVREGVRSYHANGYLVAVNTPEITATRIARNFRTRLQPQEQTALLQEFDENPDLWEKVLGKGSLELIKQAILKQDNDALTGTTANAADTCSSTVHHAMKLKDGEVLSAPVYHGEHGGGFRKDHFHGHYIPRLKLYPTKNNDPTFQEPLPEISLMYGSVLVDHKPVEHGHIHENYVFWKRTLAEGKVEHGAVRLAPHGQFGTGAVHVKQKVSNGVNADREASSGSFVEKTIQVSAAASELKYSLSIDDPPVAPDPPFYVVIGHKVDEQGLPSGLYGEARLSDAENTILGNLTFTVPAPLYLLSFKVKFQVLDTSLFPYTLAEGTLSADGHGFAGVLTEKTEEGESITHSLKGKVVTDNSEETQAPRSTGSTSSVENIGAFHTAQIVPVEAREVHVKQLRKRHEATSAPSTLLTRTVEMPNPELNTAYSLYSSVPLTVERLSSMTPPDTATLNQLGQDKMLLYTKHSMTEEERKLLNAEDPTTLNGQELEFLTDSKVKTFLQKRFGYAYLSQGFLGSDLLKGTWGDEEEAADNNLPYFWSGAGTTSLSTNASFNNVQQFSARMVFSQVMTGLEPYLDDNPTLWAKKLYDDLTGDRTKFESMIDTYLAGSVHQLNMYSMMLYTLDPDKSYASNLYNAVQMGALIPNILSVDPTEFSNEFLTKSIQQLVVKILDYDTSDNSDPNSDVFKGLQEELAKAFKEQSINQETDHVQQAIEFTLNTQDLGATMLNSIRDYMKREKKSLPQALSENAANPPEVNSKWRTTGEVMFHLVFLAGLAYGMYALIKTAMSWKELSTDEKVGVVTQIIAQSSQIVQNVVSLVKIYRDKSSSRSERIEAGVNLSEAVNAPDAVESFERGANEVAVSVNPDDAEMESPAQGNMGRSAATAIQEEPSTYFQKWKENLDVSEKVAEGLNILMMTAATVSMGLQLAADLKGDQPTSVRVLDVISVVANAIGVVIAVGSFVAVSTAALVLPIVGAAVALVGMVVDIVLSIIHKNPPPKDTPQQTWIKNVGKEFVRSLDVPSPKWTLGQLKESPAPIFNNVSAESGWMSEILLRSPPDATYSISSGTFVPSKATSSGVSETYSGMESAPNKVGFSVTPAAGSSEAEYPSSLTFYVVVKQPLSSGHVQNVSVEGWNDSGWEEMKATAKNGWYIYRAQKVDSTAAVPIEVTLPSTGQVYFASVAVSATESG